MDFKNIVVLVARQMYPGSESLTLNMSGSNLIGNTAFSLGGALYLSQLTRYVQDSSFHLRPRHECIISQSLMCSGSIENCTFLNDAGIEGSAVFSSGTPLTATNLQCSGTLASLGKITCASPMSESVAVDAEYLSIYGQSLI